MTVLQMRRGLFHTTALAGALAVSLAATGAHAQERAYNIPAQSLAESLRQYGLASGEQIIFAERMVSGRQAPALQGSYNADDALKLLLADSGLTATRTTTGGIMIMSASDPQSGSAAGDGADQGTVQALIVTAQKREEDIQDVPIAISAFTQEDLTRSQVAGGPDLMTQVPNFTFTKTNFSSYSIQIRGIGTQAISATTDPAVAVAFNNTPFIRNHFFEQEFYDLARVEVLRGPQGTLYGRNATAGVVNVISAKPSYRFEARLSGDVSNYSSSRLEGMVNLPLASSDRIALRIAGAWTKRDGFVKNILTGQQTDGRDLWSTRVSLGMEPTDNLSVNLIWEHFEENDDRLRSGKQLCHSDPGPSEVNGKPVGQNGSAIEFATSYFSQGCLPASLYSPDSFDTPNGYALSYYGAAAQGLGAPVDVSLNPYVSKFQSRDLREIETHLTPDYEASANVFELQLNLDLPYNLSLASETGFSRDRIYSFEDFNRFDTTPGVFVPGGGGYGGGGNFTLIDPNGVFCDPQLDCTNRLAAGDLSTAWSQQFSQEFRLSSDFDGPFNFNLGANFLRYDTEDKYYVFINSLTAIQARFNNPWVAGVSDNGNCIPRDFYGPVVSDPNRFYIVDGCTYIDPNDIHHLNDNGRNYFLSRNPYHLLSYATFGEAYYNISPALKLTMGLRWTVDKKTAPQIPSWLLAGPATLNGTTGTYGTPTRKVIEQEWREPTGRIALDWKPTLSFTDETLVYGSYVRGYKAGGANPPPPVVVLVGQVCPPNCTNGDIDLPGGIVAASLTHPETFKPEFVNAFEVGTKNTLLQGRLTANLSAFYYDYKGYQISQIVDRSAVNLNFDATVKGVELEMDWRPLENLRLGFKGGYEDTRLADGSKAIDLMDRTAGTPGWILVRPMPPMSSNCVFPEALATLPLITNICSSYLTGLDPVTFLPYVPNPTVWDPFGQGSVPLPPQLAGYPGFDPASANNGEGFTKDLSGNKLPNAPEFTATITADYTLPLPNDWLMTLHTDLYYQSEAWTRIFNTPGYDKLKAYNNINLAAIFSNESAGWQVMAYVKNVLDRDSITGSFLNSDDTGLTTNVFLTEPRLYGVRVTKNWTGGDWWSWGGSTHRAGDPYPLTVEVGLREERLAAPGEAIMPFSDIFSGVSDLGRTQDGHFDWNEGREVRLIYQPSGSPWRVSAGARHGRTITGTSSLRNEQPAGPTVCKASTTGFFGVFGKLSCDPNYGPADFYGYELQNKYDPANLLTPINRAGMTASRREEHMLADFAVGKEVGLGVLGEGRSSLSAGIRYAQFKSSTEGGMVGVPDLYVPDGWGYKYSTFHHYVASFEAQREFKGAGPALSWEASRRVWGNEEAGHVNVDWALTGGALFGKQKTTITGAQGSDYTSTRYGFIDWSALPSITQTPITPLARNKSVTVPVLDSSLGLSYEVQRFKVGAGYRWERYYNVLDAGYQEHKSYDRTIDGPYIKLSVGFGG